MTATWEVQKSLYTALSADTNFMTKIGSRLFDEPPTDETYPYVILGSNSEIRLNKLSSIGYEVLTNITIYTKAGRLGYKEGKEILQEMNRVLNRKIFAMATLTMIQCYYISSDTDREEDKRILNARYTILIGA